MSAPPPANADGGTIFESCPGLAFLFLIAASASTWGYILKKRSVSQSEYRSDYSRPIRPHQVRESPYIAVPPAPTIRLFGPPINVGEAAFPIIHSHTEGRNQVLISQCDETLPVKAVTTI